MKPLGKFEAQILNLIRKNHADGEPSSYTSVKSALKLSKVTASRTISLLVSKGLITRSAKPWGGRHLLKPVAVKEETTNAA